MCDNDEKLVKAAIAGDRLAFDLLVQHNYRKSVGVATRLLGNVDDALDVAQQAFIRAYQALGQLNNPAQFSPWLMKITVNQALNYRRQRSRQRAISLNEPFANDQSVRESPLERLQSREPSPLENLAGKDTQTTLQNAIDELPDNLRTPLLLFSVEKLPQKEIAKILDCSLQSVKWSVFEARRRLRKRLEEVL